MRFYSLWLASVLYLSACASNAPTGGGANYPIPEAPSVDLAEEPDSEAGDAGEQPAELLVLDEEDEPIPGAWVWVVGPDEAFIHTDSDGDGIIAVPSGAGFFVKAGARGFAVGDLVTGEDLEPVASRIIHLERCAWVEITIPDSLELPKDPWFVAVSLAEEEPDGSLSLIPTTGIDHRGEVFDLWFRFGNERRVQLAAPGGPQFEVEWWLIYDTETETSVGGMQDESDMIIVNEEGDPMASFELSPAVSAIEIENAIRLRIRESD